MKIFFTEGVKVNFVDENNVFCGYDLNQDCCEYADWFIDSKIWRDDIPDDSKNLQPIDEDLSGWVFDKEFFEEIGNSEKYDEGGMVVFKITKGKEEKFIHIFNSHNGYYSHGFEFKSGDDVIKASYL